MRVPRWRGRWELLDSVAHFLYCPRLPSRPDVCDGQHHHAHLIPGRWLAYVCDRYDLALGVTDIDRVIDEGEPVEFGGR